MSSPQAARRVFLALVLVTAAGLCSCSGSNETAEPGVSISTVVAATEATSASPTPEPTATPAATATAVENIDLPPSTSTLLAPAIVNNEVAQRASIYAGYTLDRLWSGPFVRPSTAAIGDIYGIARGYNGGAPTDFHRGTDFVAKTGDPI